MITIIYGEDTTNSREYYYSQKKSSLNPIVLTGKEITHELLGEVLQTDNLFFEKKELFIEDFLLGKKGKEFEALISHIQKFEEKFSLFFWEKSEIPKTTLSFFKNPILKKFDLPKSIFLFLDSVYPGSKQMIPLLHQALTQTPPELLLFLLTRHFRILLSLTDQTFPIDEVKKLAPWQKQKYERQGKGFTQTKLLSCFDQLYEIEHAAKTGSSPLSLIQQIDFFLLGL